MEKSKMDIRDLLPSDDEGRLRIIQEQVPGNQISLAHIIGGPQPIIYQKLGLNPDIDYDGAAIGILTVVPYESSVIAADIATKSGSVDIGFLDRFGGSLLLVGDVASVESALKSVIAYFDGVLHYASVDMTRT